MNRSVLGLCMVVGLVMVIPVTWTASILDSKHNLSISGPGPVKSTTEEEVCIFCHTPHQARRDVPYLWNRQDMTTNYTTYESSTLYATVGQPSGASKMCLSCHDGTIALGAVLSKIEEIPFAGGIRFLPEGATLLGSDISDDHPVSFLYDDALAASNTELVSPTAITGAVKLDKSSLMQCTSCHEPHDNMHGKFLVMPNNYSALCTTCHDRTDWPISPHATSRATWDGIGTDPWQHTSFTSVAENGCENCHRPHTAGGHSRLLNYLLEEDNCLVCHNGNVAAKDIEAEIIKQYRHGVQDYSGIHDPTEDFTSFPINHVECMDCHNPHRANNNTATAPNIPGSLTGVKGISLNGMQVQEASYLYEVCFKCHADNNVLGYSEITRQHQQTNTRLEFDITNPSYHPVAGIGQNPNVPSLLSPLDESSQIYCTDCHNSDNGPANNGTGPNGPHGSINKFLLERNYTTTDNTAESSYEYALCYKCHDRNRILSNASGFPHSRHVGSGMYGNGNAPCSTCHDPHGISSLQGNAINNSHLINFNLNVVSPNASGLLKYEDLGTFTGRCYLSCHGQEHNPRTYPGGM